MAVVCDWPPLAAVGHLTRRTRPGAVSYDQSGHPLYSQSQTARLVYDVTVHDVSRDLSGAGYIDMLHRRLDGRAPLVRIAPIPPLWWGATRGLDGLRGAVDLEWLATGRTLAWTSGGTDMVWTSGAAITATAVSDGDFDAIACTGLPASRVVAYPGELVRDSAGTVARVMKREESDSSGNATIRLDGPLVSGEVTIGTQETKVMFVTSWPSNGLGLGVSQSRFQMIEVFESQYSGGFTYEDPWS